MEKQQLVNIIGKYFDYSFDFKFIDVVIDVIERIDFDTEDLWDEVYQAIDDGLIYYEDQWTIAMHYTTPKDMVWDDVIEEFSNDICAIAQSIKETPFNI